MVRTKDHELVNAAEQSRNELSSLASDKSQTINISHTENTIAEFDFDRIVQVLNNLVSNSIKFSPVKSVIEIELSSLHKNGTDYIKASIRDDSVGIR